MRPQPRRGLPFDSLALAQGRPLRRGDARSGQAQRNDARTRFATKQVCVFWLPTSSMVMSVVGQNAAKSKMKRPPGGSSDCVAGFTTRPPRLIETPVIVFFDPFTGVMPSVIRVFWASP